MNEFLAVPVLTNRYKVINPHYLNVIRPCVFVCNHQSTMDLLPMGKVFPTDCVVMAKSSMKWYPFLGWFSMSCLLIIFYHYWLNKSNPIVQAAKSVFINRSNRDQALKTMADAAKQLKKDKTAVWIFPEGTRARLGNNDMLPFKKGAFHLAIGYGYLLLFSWCLF